MTNILFIIQILFSLFIPIWLYFWINKKCKEQSTSCLDLKHNVSNIHFLLKHWWAEHCIQKNKRKEKNSRNDKEKHVTNANIEDKDGANSVFFYAADQKGNSLFVKFTHRASKIAEVSLQLTTSDGQVYVLPAYPDTTLTTGLNQGWTAAGLKIEFLESERRWRIIYNGMLRNLSRGDECTDDNVEHIRLNFIFIARRSVLRWPEDWSTQLHAEALACERWESSEWINKIKLLEHTGYDLFGSMLGQVTYKNGSISTLYLRGLHQHRWGKHESNEFHESVVLFGVSSYGATFYLDMSSTKHSFSQIQFGQFSDNNEEIRTINKIGLTLSDFKTEKFNTSTEYKTWFIANNKRYDVSVKLGNSVKFYYGQPWNWSNKVVTVKLDVNGISGTGLLQLRCPYDGPCEKKTRPQLQFLKSIDTYVQKNDYVVRFDDGKCQNESIVGGKGLSLAMLTSIKNADFTVPEGFCVTTFALELQLRAHEKLKRIIDDIESVSVGKKDGDFEKHCEDAMRVVESTPIVEEVKNAIIQAIEDLELENDKKPYKYAIRSSAVGEDSEETSAAGQNSTYLGIRDVDNIIKSVAKCWASLFSYQSVRYRKQHGMSVKTSMGVCIQRMVDADAAGVMFTRHPTTGDPSEIIITANYGLGESVVSATVEPDTITVHRSWNNKLSMKSSTAGNKREKILSGDNGVVTIELNDQEKEIVCLSEQLSLRLAAIGMNLEYLFGSPRDAEWAVINEDIYLLQARPITTLYTWTDFELIHENDTGVPSDIDIITFANVGEVFPNPVSPLTTSVVLGTFNSGVANVFKTSTRSFFHVVSLRSAVNYYDMFLPRPGKTVSLMNKISDIAVCGNVVITPEIHRIACERNGKATTFLELYGFYDMVKAAMKNSEIEETAKKCRESLVFNADDFHTAHSLYNEINQQLEKFIIIGACHMHTTRVSIIYQIIVLSLLTKGYENLVSDHFSDIALVLGSCSEIASGEVVTGLKKILRCIKTYEKNDEFQKIDPLEAINWLKVNCPIAASEIDIFLKTHGHRCIQEMDFLSEPWSLKPENLIRTLQMMKNTDIANSNKALTAEDTIALLKTPKSSLTKWILKKAVPHSRKAVVRRELTKAILVDLIHIFRLAYRRLGKLMVLEGYLPEEDLIFFLTKEEIGQILNDHNTALVQKAFRRKRLFPRLYELRYPEINIGMPIPEKVDLDVTIDEDSMKVQGTPVCGGSISNRACVITDIADAKNIQQGDILITRSTDVAWSPYFPLLSGIVTELGGLISHGAVVAREYGLPCIVGAKKATQLFQTGDIVLLAADAGVLQLVKKHN
ncbi:uncharacterized protein LOC108624053 isoform X2 [Ceratina calcarata]|uniref:Uncharacterized protein LOC108624053 isoform X2 n=1 Tax=Ceratina calcarata TaxID=156304 RepID=A0AAJ7IWU9_9HYME|nr:uncharacterized protein LOC108624053 isoform X2 [Ceratina calcarata]